MLTMLALGLAVSPPLLDRTEKYRRHPMVDRLRLAAVPPDCDRRWLPDSVQRYTLPPFENVIGE